MMLVYQRVRIQVIEIIDLKQNSTTPQAGAQWGNNQTGGDGAQESSRGFEAAIGVFVHEWHTMVNDG